MKEENKEFIHGSGPFVNERGMEEMNGNTLIYHWRKPMSSVLTRTLFAACWNGIVLSIYLALTSGGPIEVRGIPYNSLSEAFARHPSLFMFLLFPLVGVFLAYGAVCLWVNKTTFRCDGFTLSVKVGPLPVMGASFQLPCSTITQFYVQKNVSTNSEGAEKISYRVIAANDDGPQREIFNAHQSYQNARILEQWLEARMGIEDKSVPEEVA